MARNPDVLIVGGGIVGAAIAWRLAKDGLAVALLAAGPVGRAASWAAGGLVRAPFLPDIAQVRNNRMAVALCEAAAKKGAEIRPDTPVTGFLRVPGRVNGVKTPRGDVYAGTTVLAAGAWSAELIRPLGLDLQVRPVKGQMLLAGAPPDFCRRMILDGESYLIPRADGRILIGSTLEDVGFDKSVTIDS